MERPKVGGYESHLTPRAEAYRDEHLKHKEAWGRMQAETHRDDIRVIEHVLSSMRLDELTDIAAGYLRRAGVPAEEMNTDVLQKVFARPIGEETSATYAQLTNHISFSTDSRDFAAARQALAEGRELPERVLLKMQLYLIHEMCHGISRNRLSSVDIGEAETTLRQESGYHSAEYSLYENPDTGTTQPELSLVSFEAFNEGVTQRIAEEIFTEYGRRTGASSAVEEFLRSTHELNGKHLLPYLIFANQVGSMCERIAAYTGVTEEAVWRSFVRGYFEQPQLFHTDTIELFATTFGPDFLRQYGSINNTTSTSKLGMFDAAHHLPHPREYADKWLRHLGLERAA